MESSGNRHGALLAGVHVPCGQSRSLYINSNVLGVSLHRDGVRTVAFLSFACKSMSEARSLHEDNGWAESVPSLKLLQFSSWVQHPHEDIRRVLELEPTVCQELPRQMPQPQTGGAVRLGARRLPRHPLKRGAAVTACALSTFLHSRDTSLAAGLGFRGLPRIVYLFIQDGAGTAASVCWSHPLVGLTCPFTQCQRQFLPCPHFYVTSNTFLVCPARPWCPPTQKHPQL